MPRSSLLVSGLAVLLVGCGAKTAVPTGTGAIMAVLPVLEAVGWTTDLSTLDTLSQQAARPSAMMGVFASDYLQGKALSLIESAMAGIHAQETLDDLNDPVSGTSATIYNLLAEMQTTVNVDVGNLLNRSTDRAVTLDKYVRQLEMLIEKGKAADDGLKAEITSLTTQKKTAQADVAAYSKSQKEATKAGQYQQAGELQAKLDDAQKTSDDIDRQLAADKDAEKNLGIVAGAAASRKMAIDANREILIAGLKVVDLPQTSSLGVLKTGNSSRSTFTGFSNP